jgi:hypothetical protein
MDTPGNEGFVCGENVMKLVSETAYKMTRLGIGSCSRWSVLGLVAAIVACPDMILLANAGEASTQAVTAVPAKTVGASQTNSPEQWRRHPSYQVFESRTTLPTMEVMDKGTLKIGEHLTLELARAAAFPDEQKKALAAQFELPVAALDKFLHSLAAKPAIDAQQTAKDLRTLILDYRYLRQRWTQYRPPPGEEKIKTDAFQSLEAGDVDKAWQLFLALSPPAPPGQLQATKGQ